MSVVVFFVLCSLCLQQCRGNFWMIWNNMLLSWDLNRATSSVICLPPPLVLKTQNVPNNFLDTWQKNGYLRVRLTERVDPPPPSRLGVLWVFLRGTFDSCLWLYMSWNKFLPTKCFICPFFWPFGRGKMSIANSSKKDNGTKKAMMRTALITHFKALHR